MAVTPVPLQHPIQQKLLTLNLIHQNYVSEFAPTQRQDEGRPASCRVIELQRAVRHDIDKALPNSLSGRVLPRESNKYQKATQSYTKTQQQRCLNRSPSMSQQPTKLAAETRIASSTQRPLRSILKKPKSARQRTNCVGTRMRDETHGNELYHRKQQQHDHRSSELQATINQVTDSTNLEQTRSTEVSKHLTKKLSKQVMQKKRGKLVDVAKGQDCRPDWESLGLDTFWEINQDTGIAEELVIVRSGKRPQTIEYEWDLWIAKRAYASENVDFSYFCLELIRCRSENNDFPKLFSLEQYDVWQPFPPTQGSEASRKCHDPSSSLNDRRRDATLTNASLTRRSRTFVPSESRDQSLVHQNQWDYLLEQVRIKSKEMYNCRRWKMRGKQHEAGWAQWEHRQRSNSRTSFVADEHKGFLAQMVKRDEDKSVLLQEVQLGYRRREDTGIGDHWMTWEELVTLH